MEQKKTYLVNVADPKNPNPAMFVTADFNVIRDYIAAHEDCVISIKVIEQVVEVSDGNS